MHILPVLDLMGGRAVRGVGGRRAEYRPVQSRLVASSDPLAIAKVFADGFGLTGLYLADLDAIAGAAPAWGVYRSLGDAGFRLWVDAGVREPGQALDLAAEGIDGVVLGLETLAGPKALARSVEVLGAKAVFSLDLRDGLPLGDRTAWGGDQVWSVAAEAVQAGVRRVIVLDLARVGGDRGLGTEALCGRLAAAFPGVEVYAGGGVTGADDLRRLRACGVRGALVASALHDGRLTREEVGALAT